MQKYDSTWIRFGRGKMTKSFEEACFNMSLNEISDIVSSDSGLHIIQRRGWNACIALNEIQEFKEAKCV